MQKPLIQTPLRLWRILRVSFLIAVIFVASCGVFVYYRISHNAFGVSEEAYTAREPINRAKLEAVLLRYEKKQTAFEALTTNYVVVSDPSE